jgi:hypothetical protein
VDCYWKECQEGEETPFDISEQQLRKEVTGALIELKNMIYGRTKKRSNLTQAQLC